MKSTSPRWRMFWKRTSSLTIQQEPVVCLDEKPVTLHADVRPAFGGRTGPGSETGQRI